MAENTIVLVVRCASRKVVDQINGILSGAGLPVQCTWIAALEALHDAFTRIKPELVIDVAEPGHEADAVVALRDQVAPWLPIVVSRSSISSAEFISSGIMSFTSP